MKKEGRTSPGRVGWNWTLRAPSRRARAVEARRFPTGTGRVDDLALAAARIRGIHVDGRDLDVGQIDVDIRVLQSNVIVRILRIAGPGA